MIKRYTAVDGTLVNVVTTEVASVHDRGIKNGLPVIKLIFSDGRPHLFVFGTQLGFNTAIEDMTIDL